MISQYLLVGAYLIGVGIECISLLRTRPAKVSIITFGGIVIFVIGMLGVVVFQEPRVLLEELFSFGMVFSFIFIAIFLKEVIRIINPTILYSLTISYWLLLIASSAYIGHIGSIIFVILGCLGSLLVGLALFAKNTLSSRHKVLLYAWFLFINGLFAILYYIHLQPDFRFNSDLHQSMLVGQSYVGMFLFGIVVVNTWASIGILYYAIWPFIFSKDSRKQLSTFIPSIFNEQPLLKSEWLLIPLVQIVLYAVFRTIGSIAGFHALAFLVLFGPKLFWLYRRFIH